MASLSLILLCGRSASAEPVVRSLSAFVAALVRGLIRDAVLAGFPDRGLGLIADHAGCAFVEAESPPEALRQAISLSRGDDLLIIEAGHMPEVGFMEALEGFAAQRRSGRGWLLRASPETAAERIFPILAPAVGLLAARDICGRVAAPSLANLLRATRARSAPGLRLRRIG